MKCNCEAGRYGVKEIKNERATSHLIPTVHNTSSSAPPAAYVFHSLPTIDISPRSPNIHPKNISF